MLCLFVVHLRRHDFVEAPETTILKMQTCSTLEPVVVLKIAAYRHLEQIVTRPAFPPLSFVVPALAYLLLVLPALP